MLKLHFLRIRNFLLGLLLILVLLTSGVTPAGAVDPRQDIPTVDPALLAKAARSDSLDFMILFEDQPDLSAAYGMDWETRGWYVYETLTAHAEENQARVRNFLDRTGVEYQAFWAANLIIVEGASNASLNGLLNYTEIERMQVIPQVMLMLPEEPTEEVDEVDEGDFELDPVETPEPEVIEEELEAPQEEEQQEFIQEGEDINLLAVGSNISQINADDAWALGYNGTGLVVGSIDTGVRYTHLALVNQYRGTLGGGSFNHNYNWWDATSGTTTPVDNNGHGTHTVGTIVGDDGGNNQIGVAPDAKWIACNAFTSNSASSTDLIECGQFMLAPWNLTETNPNPSLRPHVVNNSWGDCSKTYNGFFRDVVNNWVAAGIYPVFANGNAGNCGYALPPGLNTVGNPARYGNVTGVGSTGTNNGQYASHSNWGPTDNLDTINPSGYPKLKPQVVAPGVSIRSAVNSGNTAYGFATGTSMSAPHVAGQVALMWQAAPCLVGKYALTETLIETTATPINYNDGSPETPGHPNYATGWGEINVLASVIAAKDECAIISGNIKDMESGNAIPGATVTAISQTDQNLRFSTQTNSLGNFDLPVVKQQTYNVRVEKFGYETFLDSNVVVSTTGQDIYLTIELKEFDRVYVFLPLIIR